MRKEKPTRYSSAVGESWHHAMFKVKYCHKVFDIEEVRIEAERLLLEACAKYGICLRIVGFDPDHVHAMLDIGLNSRPEVAKKIKGYVARKLLARFPEVKKKYFWGSGLWNPSYYLETAKDEARLIRYIKKQKYACNSRQLTLETF